MEIVFVTSEMVPYAQTGGLAEVCGTLPHEIAKLGHSVSVFLPKYKSVSEPAFDLSVSLDPLHIPIGSEVETGRVLAHQLGRLRVFFIDHSLFFHRDGLYGTPMGDYHDNDRRFSFFQRGVLEALKKLKLQPDVIHCHDWQSGVISAYLKTLYRSDPFFKNARTVFTIHNLAYQGTFPPDSISTTGLSWDEFRFERLEFFGKISFLKGGIVYSDALTTVSERYAQEIQTSAFGCGMEGALQYRSKDLFGIINGIDTNSWNPERDSELAEKYSSHSLNGKAACKQALQKESQLRVRADIPLFAFVGRLSEQKGLDLIEPLIEDICEKGWQLVLLGNGDDRYHERFKLLQKKFKTAFAAHLMFDLSLSRRVYAGSDMFLMPSQFEPCGIGQMIAMRYGTVPIVREVGGLADTVHDYNSDTHEGNGFTFLEYSPETLFDVMKRAVRFYENKSEWERIIQNGMRTDFSWEKSAKSYVDVYKRTEKKALKV